jgi:hypothetical protein
VRTHPQPERATLAPTRTRTFATTNALLELRDGLISEQVTLSRGGGAATPPPPASAVQTLAA